MERKRLSKEASAGLARTFAALRGIWLALALTVGLAGVGHAATVDNTVSWSTEPANVETYVVEKQVAGGAWTALPTLNAGTMQFVDVGNTPGVNVCYRVTPQNTLPSSGAPSQICSMTIAPVGDMGPLNLNYTVNP